MTTNNNEVKKISNLLNVKNFNRLLLSFAVILGVYYLTSINDLTVKGFELQELKLETMRLESKKEAYLQKKISLEAYSNINGKISSLGMVRADNIEYISVSSNLVAKR
jgi:hypothetical protein